MAEEHRYHVTFYFSNGKEFDGKVTSKYNKEDYLEGLEDLFLKEKTLLIDHLGMLIQTKYITHVKVIEVGSKIGADKKDT
ncbi:hypothetical protein BCJMU51_p413 (plasmid) [Bacillus cereus]|uniref:hypothetical protein n=1 Tax=Bacillus cereus TaxID=1396 RepID=UPI001F471F86|nr:hypothetical protein [Bacillus cereus]BCC03735.1 hypothetical protein BCM0057_p213 [Bacillus cereus]BCC27255.1 hypothetical protein BCM0079_p211 [Bacillus cereus]BCC38802.1 hypothetical protein BCM0105_p211 [Bacillus cereus]BCC38819.1 hypothetical protein BCM0105_p313 [Bacillus cereus]BCC74285.1 hypothetical protein BCJMU51_p413 [Bacillus cereus]